MSRAESAPAKAHPLADILRRAALGSPPPADGAVEVLPPLEGQVDAVCSFTAHAVLAVDLPAEELLARLDPNDLGAPMSATFLAWVREAAGHDAGGPGYHAGGAAPSAPSGRSPLSCARTSSDHPRVRRATRYRTELHVFADQSGAGVLVIGRGLAGRWEMAFEVDGEARGRGSAGRSPPPRARWCPEEDRCSRRRRPATRRPSARSSPPGTSPSAASACSPGHESRYGGPPMTHRRTMSEADAATDAYETVIGLECHVELATRDEDVLRLPQRVRRASPTPTSARCASATRARCPSRTRRPSSTSCGSAWRSTAAIAPHSLFHRKNYFYPDMPKNFQISPVRPADLRRRPPRRRGRRRDARASASPACTWRRTPARPRTSARPGRIAGADYSLVDYNRAGVPLVEVVSEPDMRSAEEARAYLDELRRRPRVARRVRRADGGGVAALRRERLASAAPVTPEFGTKVEIKNLNSVRSLYRAVRLRGGAAARGARRRRAARAGDPPLGRGRRRRRSRCARRSSRSTTATSPSPTSRRSSPTPRGSRRSARACPSCRRPAGAACGPTTGFARISRGWSVRPRTRSSSSSEPWRPVLRRPAPPPG